jgi:hypothetical protein
VQFGGEFFERGLATELLVEPVPGFALLAQALVDVDGQADRAAFVGDAAPNRLPYKRKA